MNPSASELLIGNLVTLSEPSPPESTGDFLGGKIGVVGLISFLCAQEAEKGAAVRVAENRSIRTLFRDAVREGWAPKVGGAMAALASGVDEDLTLTGLDLANAELRRVLIALHEAVEADVDPAARARERRIAKLLLDHAQARSLVLPGQPAG